MEDHETPRAITGPARYLTIGMGGLFLVIAWIGFVLPGLPGTPFLLLASWCWIRSSPRLHRWLLESRFFGSFLRDWQTHRAVRPRVKVAATVTMVTVAALSFAFGGLRGWALLSVVGLSVVGLIVILRLPVVRRDSNEGSASASAGSVVADVVSKRTRIPPPRRLR